MFKELSKIKFLFNTKDLTLNKNCNSKLEISHLLVCDVRQNPRTHSETLIRERREGLGIKGGKIKLVNFGFE